MEKERRRLSEAKEWYKDYSEDIKGLRRLNERYLQNSEKLKNVAK